MLDIFYFIRRSLFQSFARSLSVDKRNRYRSATLRFAAHLQIPIKTIYSLKRNNTGAHKRSRHSRQCDCYSLRRATLFDIQRKIQDIRFQDNIVKYSRVGTIHEALVYTRHDNIRLVCPLCNVERGCRIGKKHVGDVLCHVVLTVEWISSCGGSSEEVKQEEEEEVAARWLAQRFGCAPDVQFLCKLAMVQVSVLRGVSCVTPSLPGLSTRFE